MADRTIDESELLIRVDETVKNLTSQFAEFTLSIKEKLSNYDGELDDIHKELETLKKLVWMAIGGLSVITTGTALAVGLKALLG